MCSNWILLNSIALKKLNELYVIKSSLLKANLRKKQKVLPTYSNLKELFLTYRYFLCYACHADSML